MAPHDASTQQGNAVAASKSLKVATVTWNMANREPSDDDIQLIMEKLREMDADVVIVATQEERRLEQQTLACKLNESLGFEVTESRHAYNTMTTGFGRVAACVLARSGITVECLGVDKFAHAAIPGKYPNKGGVTLRFECKESGQPAVRINAACVHLDSYDEQARLQEMQILMAKLSGTSDGFVDWKTFEHHAADLTIAAGDFNYRIERAGAGKFTNTPRALTYVQTSRCLVDAAPELDANVTYCGKNQSVASPLFETHDARTEDTHRTVVGDGQDATVSCKGGRLDRVHFDNGREVKHVIVERTCTSDHKPVVAMTTVLPAENSFKRARSL